MREVEVKASVKDTDQILENLASLGCNLSAPIQQKDTVYVPKGFTIPVPNNVNVLRLREQGNKAILTLKINVTNQLDCIEKELEVSDAKEMEAIILHLGFEQASVTEKFRRKGKVGDIEVCLDSVTGLGDFIEAERLVEEPVDQGIQKELFAFLQSLGVAKEDQAYEGYDILLKKKLELTQ